jgi:ribosomal protein S18 acetylase RimI-like enzyme
VDEAVVVTALEKPTTAQFGQTADLFDQYRAHYGEAADPERSLAWLERNFSSGVLDVFTAEVGGEMVGFAITMAIPASLRLGHYWQIKDLFVVPQWRRVGIARALLDHLRSGAVAAGALRLVLQTETDNLDALRLYEGSGFVALEGYRSLMLPLACDE